MLKDGGTYARVTIGFPVNSLNSVKSRLETMKINFFGY